VTHEVRTDAAGRGSADVGFTPPSVLVGGLGLWVFGVGSVSRRYLGLGLGSRSRIKTFGGRTVGGGHVQCLACEGRSSGCLGAGK
jgi:hypothetical protein